jgi:pimeloyl-ACP methyl ester carboxylesterase
MSTFPPPWPANESGQATEPDLETEPSGFVVIVEPGDRIHFLDWGGPATSDQPAVVLIHGLSTNAWLWAPVARRLTRRVRTVAVDLRGHGLSDAPTSGYDLDTLASDLEAVADGAGMLRGGYVVAGHGFGACVAAAVAARNGDACRGLVLVDGGWDNVGQTANIDIDEFLRTLDEPPEVLRSIDAFLADRRGFDPATWDADQDRAARATVVETAAGKVVPATRPHVVEAIVRTMFDYRPVDVLSRIGVPMVALAAADDEEGGRTKALARVQSAREAAGLPAIVVERFPGDAHNLMRYRPREVTAAILGLVSGEAVAVAATSGRPGGKADSLRQ